MGTLLRLLNFLVVTHATLVASNDAAMGSEGHAPGQMVMPHQICPITGLRLYRDAFVPARYFTLHEIRHRYGAHTVNLATEEDSGPTP